MIVVALNKRVQEKAKALFSMQGNITKCANETGVHRTTISRIVEMGRGDEEKVNAITEYVKSMKVA